MNLLHELGLSGFEVSKVFAHSQIVDSRVLCSQVIYGRFDCACFNICVFDALMEGRNVCV